jgi:hypothetical protein
MAFWLKTDGTIHEVHPAAGVSFTLEELQTMVGGYIEVVVTHTRDLLICNENGKLTGLPMNEQATERYLHGKHDPIVGDVVICTWREMEGDGDGSDEE